MKKTILLFLAILLVTNISAAQDYTMLGQVKSYEEKDNSIIFHCKNGESKISFLTNNIVRIQMTPFEIFPKDGLHLNENGPYAVVKYKWKNVNVKLSKDYNSTLEQRIYRIKAGNLILKVNTSPFKIRYYNHKGKLLAREKKGAHNAGLGYRDSLVFETMHLPRQEHFFGFGGYKNPLDMRGHKMQIFSSELGETNKGGGFPVPFFLSTHGYGIFFNNLSDKTTFKMGITSGQYSFHAPNGRKEGWDMDYYFIYGPNFSNIMKSYTKITGKPILPAKWYFGHMQSKCCDWNQDSIVTVAQKYRKMNLPLDVVVIDLQGVKDSSFQWSDKFKNPKKMYNQLDQLDIKTIKSSPLQKPIYNWANFDPTKPKSAQDYWSKHKKFVNEGNDGWWQDNAEHFSDISSYRKFSNGYPVHQLFGSLWAKIVVEGMEKMGRYGRPVLSRAGGGSGHRYIIPWPGDLAHGIKYMKSDLDFIRGAGLAAYPYASVDLGGFHDNGKAIYTNANVIRRMIDFVPIVPISRAHGAGKGAMEPWNLSERQIILYRKMLKFRYRLNPYIYSAAIEGHLTGRPILAPLVFDYQNDENTYNKDYEFMFGHQFLAAPVLKKRTQQWEVYLPKGQWIHHWTGKKYAGGKTITVKASLHKKSGLPLFVKSGSIIPMMKQAGYIDEKELDKIIWNIYPQGDSHYTWYDKASAKPKDKIKKTEVFCKEKKTAITIKMENARHSNKFIIHMEQDPEEVFIDDKKLKKTASFKHFKKEKEGWYYGPKPDYYGGSKSFVLQIKTRKDNDINLKIIK